MIEQVARYRRMRDRSIFVGDPDDVVPDAFGPGCRRSGSGPRRTSTSPATSPASTRPRSPTATRCAPSSATTDEQVCIVTVGGSGVGRACCGASSTRTRRPRPRPGPADDRRRRAPHRPARFPAPRRARDPRVRPRPAPPPRGLRHRDRAGRPDDDDGADGQPAPVPLLPAAPPLRAELPRAVTASSATAPAGAWTSRPTAPPNRRRDRRGDRPRRPPRPVETGGAARAAALIAELL